jgi:hypothetical protein
MVGCTAVPIMSGIVQFANIVYHRYSCPFLRDILLTPLYSCKNAYWWNPHEFNFAFSNYHKLHDKKFVTVIFWGLQYVLKVWCKANITGGIWSVFFLLGKKTLKFMAVHMYHLYFCLWHYKYCILGCVASFQNVTLCSSWLKCYVWCRAFIIRSRRLAKFDPSSPAT